LEEASWTSCEASSILQILAILTNSALLFLQTFLAISNALFTTATNHYSIHTHDVRRPPKISIWAGADASSLVSEILIVSTAMGPIGVIQTGMEVFRACSTHSAFLRFAHHVVILGAAEITLLRTRIEVGTVPTGGTL